jgi:hypothetical protein
MAEEQELDRLFGLPLDAFVAARDEAVRRLKRNGDPGAAERLGALRKPSVPAWAVNQVARKHPDRLGRLLERGTRQRAAHRAAVAGGGRAGLADAARDERAAVSELVELAAKELEIAGRTVSEAVRERIAGVLHAAARGEPGADLVRRGRLLRDIDPGGSALLGPAGSRDVAAGAHRPAGHDPAQERSAADLRTRDEARRRARAAADAAVLARRQAERLRHAADRAEEQASRTREAAQAAAVAEQATSEQATRAVAKLAELETSPAE